MPAAVCHERSRYCGSTCAWTSGPAGRSDLASLLCRHSCGAAPFTSIEGKPAEFTQAREETPANLSQSTTQFSVNGPVVGIRCSVFCCLYSTRFSRRSSRRCITITAWVLRTEYRAPSTDYWAVNREPCGSKDEVDVCSIPDGRAIWPCAGPELQRKQNLPQLAIVAAIPRLIEAQQLRIASLIDIEPRDQMKSPQRSRSGQWRKEELCRLRRIVRRRTAACARTGSASRPGADP